MGPDRGALHDTALLRDAIEALVGAGGEVHRAEPGPNAPGSTVAVEVSPPGGGIGSIRTAMEALGLVKLPRGGRQWVGYDHDSGRWVELRVAGDPDRRWPVPRRIRGIGVALMGADGAGKSTVAAAVAEGFHLPVRSVYMGLHQEGSRRRRSPVPGLGLAAAIGRQWGRWARGLGHRLRGRLVLFDRYTYDALLPSDRPLSHARRLRRMLLARACPRPDLVVVLDAPAGTLFARAGEHDLELLERHRQGLLALARRLPRTVIVDAAQAPDAVARDVIAAIWRAYCRRSAA